MPSIFSKLKGKDGLSKSKSKKATLDGTDSQPQKPRWEDAYTRKTVDAEEVQELISRCTEELKARALDHPFLLLPYRPTSDPSAVRTFIRHFFDGAQTLRGEALVQELRMAEPMVVAGVTKWCWARLQGGVVGWDAYELFKVGEQDSNMARDSFTTFIPLSVDSDARAAIITDFFDLLSAIAAHGKMNGMSGRKLSRMAAWWAFEHSDTGNGFEGGYKAWLTAADATSHLFFAYLRSLAPQPTRGGISMLPMSLQKLLQETEYPPQRPMLMQTSTNKVVMIVDTVSPTPFALLRRANHFQYRDDDRALREYSEYEDPVQALTEECKRVLKAISAANQSQASSSKHSTSLRDASWSRFADNGFSSTLDEEDEDDDSSHLVQRRTPGLRSTPASGLGLARPTTPSWADFLSSGFVDDNHHNQTGMLLPPDKFLPPIETTVRQKSSQSHQPRLESEKRLEPGELASITRFDLDDAFWWVWMSSLSPEETPERKSAFGRCAVIETVIRSGRWLVVEEMVKGAAPEPDPGAYIAEKKSFFSWTRRGKSLGRRKSTGKNALDKNDVTLKTNSTMASKTSIGPDQHARIQAAAQQLQAKQARERKQSAPVMEPRRREDDRSSGKTDSVLTTNILNEASSALKWASQYDKDALREVYLSDAKAGRGVSQTNGNGYHPGPSASMQELRSPVGPSMSARELRSPALIGPSKSQAFSPTQPSPGPSATSPALASPVPPRKEPYGASEKAVEAPKEPHPAERPAASTSRQSPVPPPPPKEAAKQPTSMEIMRNEAVSPEPGTSPGAPKPPQKKLHKEVPVRPAPVQQEKEKDKDKAAPGPGGFRKLFGRPKIRQSKVPENAAAEVDGMLARDSAAPTPEPARPVSAADPPMVVSSPETEPEKETAPVTSPTAPLPSPQKPQQPQPEPTAAPQQRSGPPRQPEPTYEPSLDSRVDTDDAREAQDEFSRFDQGPLVDQPAFVPEDTDSDDATPPPIARRKEPVPVVAPAVHKAPAVPQQPQPQPQPQPQQQQTISVRERVAAAQATSIPVRERPTVPSATAPAAAPVKRQAAPTTETEKPAVLAPQDRWAQIRKNAAERAAQRQADDPMPRGAGYRKPSGDHDDDTSGEETIESRVARIKARVAELTGNMEAVNGPGPRVPPVRR